MPNANRRQTCAFEWVKSKDRQAWEEDFKRLPKSNIMQAPAYDLIAASSEKMRTRRAYIILDGQKAGMFQIIENATLFGIFHVIALDRGPLWLEGFGGAADLEIFFRTFNELYPVRKGRKRRIMPEIEDGFAAQAIMKQLGLDKDKSFEPYQTLWLDLTQSEEELWNNLDGIWKNNIKRARNKGIKIEYDTKGKYLSWMLRHYEREKTEKSYKGTSSNTVTALFHAYKDNDNFLIARAMMNGHPLGAINIITHGTSATYQIACRHLACPKTLSIHHYLLWETIRYLKDKGIKSLDMGGTNQHMPKGLVKFKNGSGGCNIRLIGHYT